MRTRAVQATVAVAVVLLVSSLAAGLLGSGFPGSGAEDEAPSETHAVDPDPISATDHDPGDASPAEEAHDHDADDHEHDAQAGYPAPAERRGTVAAVKPSHDHFRSGEDGQIPSRGGASGLEHQLRSFTVRGDEGLAEMDREGYLEGAGTLEQPYVIDSFRVRGDLTITDTTKPIVIRNSYIEGQLTLNYNGPHVYVHHNRIKDLRVNENVQRDGPTTAGLFEHNDIEFIGQLRHFSGEFRHNTVGPRPDNVVETFLSDTGERPLPEDLVWNFDGYHLGSVHNNTVDGRVDIKLHGHYHGSCSDCPAHDHDTPSDFPEAPHPEGAQPTSRHSLRYHTLSFTDNLIRVDQTGTAVRLYDAAHEGDDETANSEPNPYLEDLHDHHTYLNVAENRLRGGSLVLDIVNARNGHHEGQVFEALVDLTSNDVERQEPISSAPITGAYVVHRAHGLEVRAQDNTFTFTPRGNGPTDGLWPFEGEDNGPTTGFLLEDVETSQVTVTGTRGEGASYGVALDNAEKQVTLDLRDNDFRAAKEDVHHA